MEQKHKQVMEMTLVNFYSSEEAGTHRPWLPPLGGCPRMHFFPNSSLFEKFCPRNINYMPVVKFSKCLDLRKNCYSRTAS